jgi:hypothetical protein
MGRGSALRVIAVQPEDAFTWRGRLKWHFGQFEKPGVIKADDLWQDIAEKERQMWIAADDDVKAVVLTRIAADESKTCVVTHAAGYDRMAGQHLWPLIGNWARSIGSTRIEAVARPGWERILGQYGMKKTHVILEGDL